jgi:hypothetical protein
MLSPETAKHPILKESSTRKAALQSLESLALTPATPTKRGMRIIGVFYSLSTTKPIIKPITKPIKPVRLTQILN